MIFTILLQLFWVVFILFQVKRSLRSKRAERIIREQWAEDISCYMSGSNEYHYGNPFVPKWPVKCSDTGKKVWLTSEVVEVTKVLNINMSVNGENPFVTTPIKRYFTSEFAIMAKLKDDDLEQYFKPGEF